MLTFHEELAIHLIDNAVVGGLLLISVQFFSRSLETLRGQQSKDLASFTQQQNRELEAFKTRLSAEGEANRNLRLAVADLAKRLAAANQAICWVCWIAKNAAATLDAARLDTYDREIKKLLTEIVGARAVLAALSDPVHQHLSAQIKALYDLDVSMGEAKTVFLSDPPRAVQLLAATYDVSVQFDKDLLGRITEIKWPAY